MIPGELFTCFCHSGAPRSGEPGIQMLAVVVVLDSGLAPSARPGMTEERP